MTPSLTPAGPDVWHMLNPSSMSVVFVLVMVMVMVIVIVIVIVHSAAELVDAIPFFVACPMKLNMTAFPVHVQHSSDPRDDSHELKQAIFSQVLHSVCLV